jgi:ATP-dependent DNA ligase
VHEIKLDGYRTAARIDSGHVQTFTRKGVDWTVTAPAYLNESNKETSA